jgi:hypothetical protein
MLISFMEPSKSLDLSNKNIFFLKWQPYKFPITVCEGTILPFFLEVFGFHLLHILFLQQVLILQRYPEQTHTTKV